MSLVLSSRNKSSLKSPAKQNDSGPDLVLLVSVVVLIALGLVMVESSSLSMADRMVGNAFHYMIRQTAYVGAGIAVMLLSYRVSLDWWRRLGPLLFLGSVALLAVVLIPGVGKEVNGSVRWLSLGFVNIQPSEITKLFVLMYLSGYLVRHPDSVQTTVMGFLKPIGLVLGVAALLLFEPDFGAVAVILATVLGVLFLAGVRLWIFTVLLLLVGAVMALLVLTSPYRLDRVTGFMDPWADPFASGFQLTQALIAFGRGEWWGVGLGNGVQKLFYLPEAHTDFVYSIIAEELGLIGSLAVVALFSAVIWRAFEIARKAIGSRLFFGGYLALGIGLLIGLQAFINIGVNAGVLPTKGLTLPLMSYGGSSVVMTCMAIGILFRVDKETREVRKPGGKKVSREARCAS